MLADTRIRSEVMDGQQSPQQSRTAAIHSIETPDSASLPSLCQVMTVPEVAQALRVSKAHVHNLINGQVRDAKPLPSVRIGRRRLVRRSSLDEWIKTSEQCYDPIIANH
jgi:excisionase family DNA binding protein